MLNLDKLKVGGKYTVLFTNDFLGCSTFQITLERAHVDKWAQYSDAVYLEFRRKRKRRSERMVFAGEHKKFAVFNGHIDIPTDPFMAEEDSGVAGVTVRKSRYSSFDKRYFTDAIDVATNHMKQYPVVAKL